MSTTAANHLRFGVQAGAFISIAIGASGVAGWIFGVRQLLSITGDAPALMPMSAFALVVGGAALACYELQPRLSRLLGGILLALAAGAAFGYAFGTSFGLGGVPSDIARGAATRPGLPAPNSIVAFAFAGVALTMMARAYALTHTAALLSMLVAYTAGIGELFGASKVYGLSAYTAMSPQTILALWGLGVGILCATPHGGVMPLLMDPGAAGLVLRRFVPVAIALPVMFGALRVTGEVAGVFDTRFGTALMAVASGVLAVVLTLDIALAIRRLDQGLTREHSARAVAESESRIKDEILTLISQVLRTPANAIHAQAHLLQTGLLREERAQHAIETMSRNATRLRRYVDDAMEVASMAHGGILIEPKEIDPQDALRKGLEAYAPEIAEKGIGVRNQLTPVGFVKGDPVRLQQIVKNLLSNAVKFTSAGGEIRTAIRRDGDVVELEIADTGCGIAPEFLPHVFDPFRRAPIGTEEEPEGLGLGLAIVKHLVELHGGTVTAYSDGIGRGARFTVRLPAAPAAVRLEKEALL